MLATSGLDHDVKIFQPTAQHPTDLKALADVWTRFILIVTIIIVFAFGVSSLLAGHQEWRY